jgi:hypothetical protein
MEEKQMNKQLEPVPFRFAGFSVISEGPCPVCGKQAVTDLTCDTSEQEIFCQHCGFLAVTELISMNGREFWEETKRFPVDMDGKVQRGKLQT